MDKYRSTPILDNYITVDFFFQILSMGNNPTIQQGQSCTTHNWCLFNFEMWTIEREREIMWWCSTMSHSWWMLSLFLLISLFNSTSFVSVSVAYQNFPFSSNQYEASWFWYPVNQHSTFTGMHPVWLLGCPCTIDTFQI